VNQALAAVPGHPEGRERRRAHVVAGRYPLRQYEEGRGDPKGGWGPTVTICVMGAVVTEALTAARLERLGSGTETPGCAV
jgi:pyruvate dehydrogenase E1 component